MIDIRRFFGSGVALSSLKKMATGLTRDGGRGGHVWARRCSATLASLAAMLALLLLSPVPALADALGEDLGLASYAITYELAGGTVAGTNPERYATTSPDITLVNPTRVAYDFLGWSGTGLKGRANTRVIIPTGSTGDRSYEAHWVPASYNLSYRLSGGTDRGNPETYTIESATFQLVAPTREGYTFSGWSGTGLTGSANMSVGIPVGSTGDRSYAAHWEAIPYAISYVLDGGSDPANPSSYTIETPTFVLAEPEKEGHTFAGWSGTGLVGAANKGVRVLRGSTGDRTFTAHWTPATYTVTYDVNAGGDRTASVTPEHQDKGYQTALGTLPTPSWPGHTFNGWFTQAEGGEQVGTTTVMGAGDVTYYAHWTADPHSVTFVGDGGTVVGGATRSGRCGDAIMPPTAKRDGYAFVGWYTAEQGGTRVADWVIPAADSTYHARWWAYAVDDFPYAAGRQAFVAPVDGTYELEVWGAQGGWRNGGSAEMGGRGGYSTGVVSLSRGEILYVYVGGSGNHYGWNGGGGRPQMPSGGGATDMRLNSTSLYARLIVAGGGGSDGAKSNQGGYGGGVQGGDGSGASGTGGQGATQIGAGAGYPGSILTVGTFGTGGGGEQRGGSFGDGGTGGGDYGGAGGGGWYGGGGVYPANTTGDSSKAGGGGSGYVWTSSTATSYPAGCLLDAEHYLAEASTIAGNETFPSPTDGFEEGHPGDGHARITMRSYTGSNIVVYDANGGAMDGEAERRAFVGVGDSLGELPVPTRDGHLFIGWYTRQEGGERITGGLVPTEGATYYAHWSELSSSVSHDEGAHALTLDARGGTVGGQTTLTLLVAAGDALDELPAPTREADAAGSYVFTGWYTQVTGGERVTSVTPTEDCGYFAHWARLASLGASEDGCHAITLHANAEGATIAGAASATLLVPAGDTVDELPRPAYVDHLLTGWYTREAGGGKVGAVTPVADLTLYAHWSLVATEGFSFARLGRAVGTFAAPISGTYLLEAWGADGGSMINVATFPTVAGGKGGYSRGTVTLDKNDTLYVVVGEPGFYYAPNFRAAHAGMWNGGGALTPHDTTYYYRALAGGATHIATKKIGDGQLKGYASSKGSVVLVAGGGGGAAGSIFAGKTTDGGAGGGQTGVSVTYNNGHTNYVAYGGGQTSGGAGFGIGTSLLYGSGGGGWYGGGASALSGAGGSGRVGGLDCSFDGANATGHFTYGDETREIVGASMQGDLVGVPERPADASAGLEDTEEETGRGVGGYARVMLVTPSEGRAITLDAQGGVVEGSTAVTLLVDAGEVFGELPDATREGYAFAGWYTTTEGGMRVTADASTASGKVTYYARWVSAAMDTYDVTVETSGVGFEGVEADRAGGRLGDVVNVSIELTPGYDPQNTRANGTVVLLEEQGDGSWLWRYTVGDADATLTLTTSPITYTITYELPDGATTAQDDPTTYTVESDSITLGGAIRGGDSFLGWYTPEGERVTTITHGSTGDLTLRAFFDVDLYDVVTPVPHGQAGGTLGVADVGIEGAAAGRAVVGSQVTVTVTAQVGWAITGWVVTRSDNGSPLGADALQVTTGDSGGAASVTITSMPASAVRVEVQLGKVAIRQVVAVRYEMPDGSWNTDPGGEGGVTSTTDQADEASAYAEHHTADVLYGETYTPLVPATTVYQAAGADAYEVTDEHVTYLDVPRKTAAVTFRYRLQDANSGAYGGWKVGHVARGVRVGESASWDTAQTGLDASVWGHVSGSGTVSAAATAAGTPDALTVSLTVPRNTYTLTVAHDGHFETTGGGTYRAGQSGIAVTATPEDGRYFVFWDGDSGPASADGVVGGLADPESGATTYTMGASDSVITAMSRGVRYSTLFDGDGGEVAFESYAAQYNETFAVPVPTRTGYAFAGWDITGMNEGEHTLIVDGVPTTSFATELTGVMATSFKNLRTMPGMVVSLTATWTPLTYAVAFDGNGATSGDMAPQVHTYDTPVALAACGYRRATYAFAGWATSEARADAGIVDHAGEDTVTNLCADPAPDGSSSVTLWAVWSEVTHDVSLRDLGDEQPWSGVLWEGAPVPDQSWGHRRLVGWSNGESLLALPGETLADALTRLRSEG